MMPLNCVVTDLWIMSAHILISEGVGCHSPWLYWCRAYILLHILPVNRNLSHETELRVLVSQISVEARSCCLRR